MKRPTPPTSAVPRLALALAAAGALAWSPSPRAAPAGATDPLVRKVVEAYGGAAALGRVKGVRQHGRVQSTMQGKDGTLARLLAVPDSLRIEIGYPDGTGETRVTHAGKGLRQGQDVSGTPPHHAMVLQAARLALPIWLAGEPGRARRAGRVEREGRALEALALELPGGLELLAEVEPATGRIVRTVGVMEGPGGGHFEFVNTYSDFRKVKGVLFAFREENYAGGQQTGVTVLEQVELLDRVPAGAFGPGKTTRF